MALLTSPSRAISWSLSSVLSYAFKIQNLLLQCAEIAEGLLDLQELTKNSAFWIILYIINIVTRCRLQFCCI